MRVKQTFLISSKRISFLTFKDMKLKNILKYFDFKIYKYKATMETTLSTAVTNILYANNRLKCCFD